MRFYCNYVDKVSKKDSCLWKLVLVFFLNLFEDVGHLDFLEKVSQLGDFLIVGLHTDTVSILLLFTVIVVFREKLSQRIFPAY